jgi:cyanophycinase-like exopeptidase
MANAVRNAFMQGWSIAMTTAAAALIAGAVFVAARTPKSADHDLLDDTLDLTDPSPPSLTPAGVTQAAST